MDFYQNVVIDYLRADRAVFVNTECCIQPEDGPNPDVCKPHWYCDAVAIDLRNGTVFLCEISYAKKLGPLIARLKAWSQHWPDVREALERDCKIQTNWKVRLWLFVPQDSAKPLADKLELMKGIDGAMIFEPRITSLESVQPWKYHSWDHQDKDTDKRDIPEAMRL